MKYRISYTYSTWENGSGWTYQDGYFGFDDDEYAENPDYTEDDFEEQLVDQTSFNVLGDLAEEEIAAYINDDNILDTQYKCTIYRNNEDEEDEEEVIAEFTFWLSDLVKKYCKQ